jgi:hypothetical protein
MKLLIRHEAFLINARKAQTIRVQNKQSKPRCTVQTTGHIECLSPLDHAADLYPYLCSHYPFRLALRRNHISHSNTSESSDSQRARSSKHGQRDIHRPTTSPVPETQRDRPRGPCRLLQTFCTSGPIQNPIWLCTERLGRKFNVC